MYSSRGRSRSSWSGKPRNNFNFKRSTTHPSRYINQAVQTQVEPQYEVQHTFTDFGLHPLLLENIQHHGYSTPTPIQDQAIPPIMEGRDLVGLANTGTGKTASFLLPLLHKVAHDLNQGVLIVVPTRELAVQISEEFHAFVRGLPIGMALCVGGKNIQQQMNILRDNPHFVIGTPGRLKDLIQRGAMNTEMFTNIVLDEVDRMLDIGFVRDIRFLITQLPRQRHSYFFSATMTREAEDIMHSFLTNPVKVSVQTRVTSSHIQQDIIRVNPGMNKVDILFDLLIQKESARVIIFGRTKHGINKLEKILLARGLRVSAIHGNKAQGARQRALDEFKKGRTQALLATDVVARGIDIDDVTHVINYDEPATYEDYIHRIGRTGRAGKAGKALTFIG